ncbi:MAG TPA: sigma-70 family RNA polymerase sigma factor [Blastocatellia bacterium]|nr:sigma-70 family RNA polymerase sigma factor [Blastocatellia bacterium]
MATERLKQAEPSRADAEELPVNLDILVEDCQSPLLRYAYRLAGDAELARDIVQEAFVRYLEAPPRARARRQIVTWLYRVTHNLAMNALSNQRRRAKTQIPGAVFAPPPSEQLLAGETRRRLELLLSRLTLNQRIVVILNIQEEKSYREISEITGLSISNVGMLLSRALKKLAGMVEKEGLR